MSDKHAEAAANVIATVGRRDDLFPWAQRAGMFIQREELLDAMAQGRPYVIVDTRDDDFAGGMIKSAMHLADSPSTSPLSPRFSPPLPSPPGPRIPILHHRLQPRRSCSCVSTAWSPRGAGLAARAASCWPWMRCWKRDLPCHPFAALCSRAASTNGSADSGATRTRSKGMMTTTGATTPCHLGSIRRGRRRVRTTIPAQRTGCTSALQTSVQHHGVEQDVRCCDIHKLAKHCRILSNV